jgi:hypothetical protein
MGKKKSEAAEVARRVEEVLRIRLDGAQFHDVVQYAAEKGWDLKDRQIRNYVRRADELLVDRMDQGRREVVARHLAQRQSLFARAVNAADYRTALAVLADEAKLRGLYDNEELRELLRLTAAQGARIKELEERLAGRGPGRESFEEMKRVARAAAAEVIAARQDTDHNGPATDPAGGCLGNEELRSGGNSPAPPPTDRAPGGR